MPGTRSQDKPLEGFVDDPEKLGRSRRKSNMAEPANAGHVVPPHEKEGKGVQLNDSAEILATSPDYYLRDMENACISDARKRAIQWGPNKYKHLVDCPGIGKFYGETTLLVNFLTGMCQLFVGGELENFPLQAAEDPFPIPLLGKILASDSRHVCREPDITAACSTTTQGKDVLQSEQV